MNKKQIFNKCKTCKHFKSGQRELNYWDNTGFCINENLSFNTRTGRLIGVFDKENQRDISKITGNPSHDFETTCDAPICVKQSRYCLQVEEDFGCIFHSKND